MRGRSGLPRDWPNRGGFGSAFDDQRAVKAYFEFQLFKSLATTLDP